MTLFLCSFQPFSQNCELESEMKIEWYEEAPNVHYTCSSAHDYYMQLPLVDYAHFIQCELILLSTLYILGALSITYKTVASAIYKIASFFFQWNLSTICF